jgi:hypothetical protein
MAQHLRPASESLTSQCSGESVMRLQIEHRFWLIAVIVASVAVGCNQQQKKTVTVEDVESAAKTASEEKDEAKKAEEKLAETKANFDQTQQRDNFIRAKDQELVQIDSTLQQLKDKARQAQGPDQENLNAKIEAVETNRDTAKKSLDSVRKAKPADWNQQQSDVENSFAELKRSLNDAQSGKPGTADNAASNQPAPKSSEQPAPSDQAKQANDYMQSKTQELAQADATLQKLKERAGQLQGPDQQNLQQKINAIQAKRDTAKKNLDQFAAASPANRQRLQGEADKSLADLRQALTDADSTPGAK